jgi:protoheme IX farnesyltransferase
VSSLGWILFGILVFWQIPHFMAIAWIYRKDYSAVNFPMLPVRDQAGGKVAGWSLVATAVLLVLSVAPAFMGLDSAWYGAVAAAVGAWFLVCALLFVRKEARDASARRLFHASLAYLPIVLGALVADRLLLPR